MSVRQQALRMQRDLNYLAKALVGAEAALPKSFEADHTECDDWCKLWMLLVGAWHSLDQAAPFIQSEPLEQVLPRAHQHALSQLQSNTIVLVPPPSEANPWVAGYYLVSAEHRIANVLDRATKLATESSPHANDRIHDRRTELAKCCQRCRAHTYPESVQAALRNDSSKIVIVYKRVNPIKHHGRETEINRLSTHERWTDVYDAALEGASVVAALAAHSRTCQPE